MSFFSGVKNSYLQAGGIVFSGAIAGGLASEISGGKFWDGFRNGLISAGLNHAAHAGYKAYKVLTVKQMLKKYGYSIYGTDRGMSMQATKEYVNKIINKLPNLKRWWIKAGKSTFTKFVNRSGIMGARYFDNGTFIINSQNIFNNYRLVSSLFHEFHHGYWNVSRRYESEICNLGLDKAHALNEIEAYEFSWSLEGYTDSISTNVYYRHINTLYR